VDAPYDTLEQVEPGIARILARNPSPYTFTGTQSYIIGTSQVAVIDPGPDLPEHVDAIVEAVGERELVAILCTHTHSDHSPASRALAERTGAPIVGCARLALDTAGLRSDASFDANYSPDRVLEEGEAVEVDGEHIVAVATPGHTSNHLCFAWRDALITGDHVMGWSTTVVVPPDGDMAAYMRSLEKLRQREDRIYYPAHGPAVENPRQYVRSLVGHRMQRERQILGIVSERPRAIPEIVASAYPELDSRLTAAAGGSVHAHLLDLQRRGLVVPQGELWTGIGSDSRS
jgi:glyoxylase-like metal-dependent hydrolase (beta-lactamase superfamily II)